MITGPYFVKLVKKLRDMILIEIVNVGHKPIVLKLVFVFFSYS